MNVDSAQLFVQKMREDKGFRVTVKIKAMLLISVIWLKLWQHVWQSLKLRVKFG
jgi:hypothetical protein